MCVRARVYVYVRVRACVYVCEHVYIWIFAWLSQVEVTLHKPLNGCLYYSGISTGSSSA